MNRDVPPGRQWARPASGWGFDRASQSLAERHVPSTELEHLPAFLKATGTLKRIRIHACLEVRVHDFHLPAVLCLVAQSCLTLCDPMDCSPPGSSVHGILQAWILGWVARPSSSGSSQPRDRTQVSRIAGGFFTI